MMLDMTKFHSLIPVFDPYEYYMDLCYELCLSIKHGKNFKVGYYMQTSRPNLFIPAILIGTIDFYHFILLSLTLTLPGGHKVSAKQILLASFSCTFI